MKPTVGIVTDHSQAVDTATALANQLQLPYLGELDSLTQVPAYVLIVGAQPLALQKMDSSMQPLSVDFASGRLQYRLKTTGYRSPLAKAVGITGKIKPTVLDLSAGLGRDAFILATLGASVQLIERNPVVAALLADGLLRAATLPHLAPVVVRMSLQQTDSAAYLHALPADHPYEVIYFDPMFPERQKSALVKKEMQILQDLLGADEDADAILALARRKATKRVVIKRPHAAPFLANTKPDFSVHSTGLRFDVYLHDCAFPNNR